jgi:uncharacterized protein with PIN domain
VRTLGERTSVKDVIESCGVPHTEVDRIELGGVPVDFSHVLHENSSIVIYPVGFKTANDAAPHLQRTALARFVADGHLGKLTRNLRLLGFDVVCEKSADDRRLLEIMQHDDRALLTRDRRLLMHSIVKNGFYPKSQDPLEQTNEVIRRFEIRSKIAPFSRCLCCNGQLLEVNKAAVMEQLEPLTRIYYERFKRCQECGQLYWAGSHFDKLRARIDQLRAD